MLALAVPMTNDEFFRAVQSWSQQTFAGLGADELRLKLSNGKWVRLPVPSFAPVADPEPPSDYTDLREKCQHLLEAASDWKTSKKLANDAGYELETDFYRCLKELVDAGHMLKGKNGYKRAVD